ncbi:SRPBCC domain-containing protein [Streptomyces sp. SYSU K217416]
MEHEVFVPLPSETLRQLLGDPARVARCVPGLQQDADEASGPLAGRLKVRIGGHTITYRGVLRITVQGEDFAVEGEGTEARGHGSVKLALVIRPRPAEGGTTLAFTGTASGDGRIKELPAGAAESAAVRLLDRFATQLGSMAGAMLAEAEPDGEAGPDAEAGPEVETEPDVETGPEAEAHPSVFEADVPPSSLDPLLDGDLDDELGDDFDSSLGVPEELPAEAAHARRTMIGRSAEEVDHAPPRGRYAPVPAPEVGSTTETLRWVAPAAALVIASAVVVGRVLRRKR